MHKHIPISAYLPYTNKRGKTNPGCIPFETDFYTEMDRIKTGYYKNIIDACRSIKDKEERNKFKCQNLPSITISCTCEKWRKVENVTSHSGLINIDIDAEKNPHITDWQAQRDNFFQSPYIVAALISASGGGNVLVFKIKPDLHNEFFESIVYDLSVIGIIADRGQQDLARLRFVSYDPNIKIRYDFDEVPFAKISPAYIMQKEKSVQYNSIKAFGKANSINNFNLAIQTANKEHSFCDGEKYKFLISLAGYCCTIGMHVDYCKAKVSDFFSDKTNISQSELLKPIDDIYNGYKNSFGIKPPKPYEWKYKYRDLKFLLRFIHKDLLKKNIKKFGLNTIKGNTDTIIKVSSKRLVFLMFMIDSSFTWTCSNEYFDEYFDNSKCLSFIQQDSILDECNGQKIWINKQSLSPF